MMIAKKRLGFTLIELLAIIVILAIILAVAVPSVSRIINNSTKGALESNAKMVLKAIDYKLLENDTFDPTAVNATTVNNLLGLTNENYQSLAFVILEGKVNIAIVGKNKWEGYSACGTYQNMVVREGICELDFVSPIVSFQPDGSASYIASSSVKITISDESLNETSLKYVWTSTSDIPNDEAYTNSFVSGLNVTMPTSTGTHYLHVIARDTNGNTTKIFRSFMIDAKGPVITINGTNPTDVNDATTYTDAGATALDDISGSTIVSSSGTVNTNIIGVYTITYTATDAVGNQSTATRTINVVYGPKNFAYTGAAQTFTAPYNGIYRVQLWGAQGGGYSGGKGGYVEGNISLTAGQTLTINVGSAGGISSCSGHNCNGGGGATYITSILYAGGGGGAGTAGGTGGAGGGTTGIAGPRVDTGYSGYYGNGGGGGSQSAPGGGATAVCRNYWNGTGGSGMSGGAGGTGFASNGYPAGGRGGTGYYGGGGGASLFWYEGSNERYTTTGGGGGSSYIGTGITNGQTIAGNASMPAPGGGTQIGQSGNGYAIVSPQ